MPDAAYPGVPQFGLTLPPVTGLPTTLVLMVHGDRTVIVPAALNVIVVGPV